MKTLGDRAILICAALAIAWLAFHFGAGLRIPIFKRWREQLETRQRNSERRCRITFDADRVTVRNLLKPELEPIKLQWADINLLTVFKRDLFSVDMICLLIGFSDGYVLEVDEQMDGWKDLIDALPIHLPGCKRMEQWIFKVTKTAFAPDPTEIYRRAVTTGGKI